MFRRLVNFVFLVSLFVCLFVAYLQTSSILVVVGLNINEFQALPLVVIGGCALFGQKLLVQDGLLHASGSAGVRITGADGAAFLGARGWRRAVGL